jgi:predicted nucleotidyltransferase
MPPTNVLAAIAERFGLADIYVFGSRADEIARGLSLEGSLRESASDVDIGVRPLGRRVLSPEEKVELTLALERSIGVLRVDLVVLPEAGAFLALAAIRGDLLYCLDATDQAEYELFVLRRAGDLAPLERERQQIVLDGGR